MKKLYDMRGTRITYTMRLMLCLISIIAFGLAIMGCPGPRIMEHKPNEPPNTLAIPPLETRFDYTLSNAAVEWLVQNHPRILARPEGIETLIAQKGPGLKQDLIKAAMDQKAAIDFDPEYREPLGPVACAWGYLLTKDQKYLETVKSTLPWLTTFAPIMKYPESANFPFIQQAYALGAIYDLLYNNFTPDERGQIEKTLREKVFHVLAYKVTLHDKNINFWADDPDSNYYLVWHATAGLVAIALMGVEPDAEALGSLCWERVKTSMDVFHQQHGWVEGLTYLDFCWGQSACYFLLAVERNSSLKPYDHPWFADSILWGWWGVLPNRATIANFGDNEPENYSVASYMGRVGALTGNPLYTKEYDLASMKVKQAIDLPVFKAACVGRQPGGPPYKDILGKIQPHQVFPGIEWAMIRTGPDGAGPKDSDDFYCAFKSGIAGYDHNHLDQGSFILAAYGQVLLSDPGRGGPDIIRRDPVINCLFEAGLGHNTMIVGDGCYLDMGLFPDNPKYFAKPGKITSTITTDKYLQFTTDNSGLYPTTPLTMYRRTFLYIRPGVIKGAELGALVIADKVEFRSPVNHSILFHCPWQIDNPSTGRATFTSDGARLEYFGASLGPSVDKIERQKTTMQNRDSTCYFRSTAGPAEGADWFHVLIPGRKDGPPVPEPEFSQFGSDVPGLDIVWPDFRITMALSPDRGWLLLNNVHRSL